MMDDSFAASSNAKTAPRKRVNTCLDQLRSLLPFTSTLKRDMASLLEQTVEYINTMHTVLNEDKPACLSKIYTAYQKKIEEHDLFRRSTPKGSKRKLSSGSGSCSHGPDGQQPSPEVFQGCSGDASSMQNPSFLEADPKRHCGGHPGWDQNIMQQAMATPTGSCMQNWHPPQHIIDPMNDMNNNSYIHPFGGAPYGGSECRGGMLGPSCYIFGQSPLPNQFSMGQRPNEQPSPFPSGKIMPPLSKYCTGITPKSMNQYMPSPAIENVFQGEVIQNPFNREENGIKGTEDNTLATSKGRKSQNCFDISSLVSNNNQPNGPTMHVTNPSPWQQHCNFQQQPVLLPYNPLQKSDNPTHHLLAPMDMTESPPNNAHKTSPQFMGVNKLLGRDGEHNIQALTSGGRDMGILLKNSSVSTMLNEVTGINTSDHHKAFGSTERSMTPVFNFVKNDTIPAAIISAMSRSTSAPASMSDDKVSTPSSSSVSEKLYDEIVGIGSVRSCTPHSGSKESSTVPTSPEPPAENSCSTTATSEESTTTNPENGECSTTVNDVNGNYVCADSEKKEAQ